MVDASKLTLSEIVDFIPPSVRKELICASSEIVGSANILGMESVREDGPNLSAVSVAISRIRENLTRLKSCLQLADTPEEASDSLLNAR